MNRNAQGGIVAYFVLLLFFIAFWAFYLATWLAGIGARAVTQHSMVGLEAFAWTYINLWVFIGLLGAGALGVWGAGGGQ